MGHWLKAGGHLFVHSLRGEKNKNNIVVGLLLALWADAEGYTILGEPWSPSKARVGIPYLINVKSFPFPEAEVVRHIEVGRVPLDLALSADGQAVYVTNVGSKSISVIDVASLTVRSHNRISINRQRVLGCMGQTP